MLWFSVDPVFMRCRKSAIYINLNYSGEAIVCNELPRIRDSHHWPAVDNCCCGSACTDCMSGCSWISSSGTKRPQWRNVTAYQRRTSQTAPRWRHRDECRLERTLDSRWAALWTPSCERMTSLLTSSSSSSTSSILQPSRSSFGPPLLLLLLTNQWNWSAY